MGNSWGNCPSNINHQVEQSVIHSSFFFLHRFFPPVSMVTGTLKDTLQEINQKEEQRIKAGEKKRAKKGKEKASTVHGCSIFSFEGPESG